MLFQFQWLFHKLQLRAGGALQDILREGNAIYGQYTFEKNKGIVPSERDRGKNFSLENLKICQNQQSHILKI